MGYIVFVSICYVSIFCGVVLSVVSLCGMYTFYVDVFGLVEMDLCYLQFGFSGWYMFGRVCYVVVYQCDEAPSCFVTSISFKCCVFVELMCFVCFLQFISNMVVISILW